MVMDELGCARLAAMSEVTAEMIENGRSGDPNATTRRRKMNARLRHARLKLTTSSDDIVSHSPELMRLFAVSNKNAMPAMAFLAMTIGFSALMWVPVAAVLTWTGFVCIALAMLYGFSVLYLATPAAEIDVVGWRRKFVFGETVNGIAWAMMVLLLIAAMMAMVASAIPYAVAGGLLPVTIAIVYVLGPTTRLDTLTLSFLCVGALVYFCLLYTSPSPRD